MMNAELSRRAALVVKELRIVDQKRTDEFIAVIEKAETISDLPRWAKDLIEAVTTEPANG